MHTPTEFPQHERLTRVLNIYRAAMRRHIAEQWSAKYPEDWFEHLFGILESREQEEIRANRTRIQRRMSEGEIALSADEENQLVMDIPMFLNAVKDRQDLFRKLADREITDDIKWLYEIRNQWAHPPLRDLSKSVVDDAIERCANVLAVCDENARNAVLNLSEISNESSPFETLQEQLGEVRDEVRNLLGPVERQQGTLIGLSDAVISLQTDVNKIKDQLGEDVAGDPTHENPTEQIPALIANIEPAVSARLQAALDPLSAQISDVRHEISETRSQIEDTELWRSSLADPVATIQKQVQRLVNLAEQGAETAVATDRLRDEIAATRAEVSNLRHELAESTTRFEAWYRRSEAVVAVRFNEMMKYARSFRWSSRR